MKHIVTLLTILGLGSQAISGTLVGSSGISSSASIPAISIAPSAVASVSNLPIINSSSSGSLSSPVFISSSVISALPLIGIIPSAITLIPSSVSDLSLGSSSIAPVSSIGSSSIAPSTSSSGTLVSVPSSSGSAALLPIGISSGSVASLPVAGIAVSGMGISSGISSPVSSGASVVGVGAAFAVVMSTIGGQDAPKIGVDF